MHDGRMSRAQVSQQQQEDEQLLFDRVTHTPLVSQSPSPSPEDSENYEGTDVVIQEGLKRGALPVMYYTEALLITSPRVSHHPLPTRPHTSPTPWQVQPVPPRYSNKMISLYSHHPSSVLKYC
jgi:hypothetical protein